MTCVCGTPMPTPPDAPPLLPWNTPQQHQQWEGDWAAWAGDNRRWMRGERYWGPRDCGEHGGGGNRLPGSDSGASEWHTEKAAESGGTRPADWGEREAGPLTQPTQPEGLYP